MKRRHIIDSSGVLGGDDCHCGVGDVGVGVGGGVIGLLFSDGGLAMIETRLAVDSVRRFATRCFTMSSSLSKLSANFAMDSSMVGGVDGVDGGGI
ncbi:hypothetical protein Tco_0646019 [Tanacetum coccineum]